jgi:hypothetical protein
MSTIVGSMFESGSEALKYRNPQGDPNHDLGEISAKQHSIVGRDQGAAFSAIWMRRTGNET